MTITEQTISIAQAAESTGLSVHTLRYYERAGLMMGPVERASSTHRRYTGADVRWIEFLTRLRSTGMPIAQVARYVELARQGEVTEPERLDLLLAHRETVVEHLDETARHLAAIDYKIDTYQGKLPDRK